MRGLANRLDRARQQHHQTITPRPRILFSPKHCFGQRVPRCITNKQPRQVHKIALGRAYW